MAKGNSIFAEWAVQAYNCCVRYPVSVADAPATPGVPPGVVLFTGVAELRSPVANRREPPRNAELFSPQLKPALPIPTA